MQQQLNLPPKQLVRPLTVPLRQLEARKALLIRLYQLRLKLRLAVMQTAIAWNACSRGHKPSKKI
jgi:hypothetical protein